jgi:hypothetical protein
MACIASASIHKRKRARLGITVNGHGPFNNEQIIWILLALAAVGVVALAYILLF